MKYYINDKEVSKEEAEKQLKINNEIMKIDDPEEWLKAAKDINFIFKMTELEKVKLESYEKLRRYYDEETAKKTVESYEKITGYFHGKPSRVMTNTGIEIYL